MQYRFASIREMVPAACTQKFFVGRCSSAYRAQKRIISDTVIPDLDGFMGHFQALRKEGELVEKMMRQENTKRKSLIFQ